MFSAVRMHSCHLRVTETTGGSEQDVDPHRLIHSGWVTTLERNREAVFEHYLRWRCEHEGVEAARIENQCQTPEGGSVPLIVRAINCASGAIESHGGVP
jgi:hypothetical protein